MLNALSRTLVARRKARNKTTLSPRSVSHVRSVLRNALTVAERDELVSRKAAALARPPKMAGTEVGFLTLAQVSVFMKALEGERLEALYVTTLGLGLRLGEITGLRWSDVDLDGAVLHVTRALQYIRTEGGGTQTPALVEPKSQTSRRALGLDEPVVEALRAHRKRWAEESLVQGERWLNRWDLVFCGPQGEPLAPWLVWRSSRPS